MQSVCKKKGLNVVNKFSKRSFLIGFIILMYVFAFLFCFLLLAGCEKQEAESLGAVIITPDNIIVVPDPIPTPRPPIMSNEKEVIIPGVVEGMPQEYSAQPSLATEIFKLTNAARQDNGLSELTYNSDLQEAANIRAKEASEMFSHTRPDGSSCHSVVEDFDYYVAGENLILAEKHIASAKRMMEEWMNSEGHRHNILLKDFTSMAVGVYEKDGYVFAAQIFIG